MHLDLVGGAPSTTAAAAISDNQPSTRRKFGLILGLALTSVFAWLTFAIWEYSITSAAVSGVAGLASLSGALAVELAGHRRKPVQISAPAVSTEQASNGSQVLGNNNNINQTLIIGDNRPITQEEVDEYHVINYLDLAWKERDNPSNEFSIRDYLRWGENRVISTINRLCAKGAILARPVTGGGWGGHTVWTIILTKEGYSLKNDLESRLHPPQVPQKID